jgi:hypothetical protein
MLNKIYSKQQEPPKFGPYINLRTNRFEKEDITARIENSLKRIDDKFSKLNQNLQRYSEIMKPARDQLVDGISQGSFNQKKP